RTVVNAGADALELGVPFSDPVADGPTIQGSHLRALDGGATVDGALNLVRQIREEFPDTPLGMLIYGNVPFTRGLDTFYEEFGAAGADAILLPDVPVREGAPFAAAAEKAGVAPVFIAPARATERTLEGVAKYSKGYIYAVSRDGVTGTEVESDTLGLDEVVANIHRYNGAPALLGFGISPPEHVADAVAPGAAGALPGSAITKNVDRYVSRETEDSPGVIAVIHSLKQEITYHVSQMKAATKRQCEVVLLDTAHAKAWLPRRNGGEPGFLLFNSELTSAIYRLIRFVLARTRGVTSRSRSCRSRVSFIVIGIDSFNEFRLVALIAQEVVWGITVDDLVLGKAVNNHRDSTVASHIRCCTEGINRDVGGDHQRNHRLIKAHHALH